jgi:thiol-disulfide isomerase/thioredoxin
MRLALPVLLLPTLCAWLPAAEPARIPPPLAIERLGAPPLDPSAYRGKIVALVFILTTCPHCQALTNVLDKLAGEYTPRGVQFLECAFDPEAKLTMKAFLDQFHPPFPVGWTNEAAVRAYLQISYIDPRPLYVPHLVLLDRAGAIRGDYRGESDFFAKPEASIRAELEKLLGPTKPAATPPSHP